VSVRIVAGEFGSRRIAVPPGRDVRPTADRAREAVFAALGTIDGAAVLDAFAGSGALGLEALSRGAATCVFVERAPRSLEVLRANIRALGVEERARVERGDALRYLGAGGRSFDLVLLDPPYGDWPRLVGRLTALLPARMAPAGRVVAELPEGVEFALPGFAECFNRRIGSARLVILSSESPP
jgi:16S rRNA (guanine966-N2)-methyltransferase